MSNARELKSHIGSVKDTQKITNAMYLIASAKLQKAKSELVLTEPYFYTLKDEIKRIFRTAPDINSKYFYPPDGSNMTGSTYGCLVITADKGLAGAYNQNVIKETMRLLNGHKNTKLFVVGEYGRQYFMHHSIPIEQSFLYTAQNPTTERAREICSCVLDLYDAGQLGKLYIVYTNWKSSVTEDVVLARLLPFHRNQFVTSHEKAVLSPFEFFPSVSEVLYTVMQSYISGYIYSALVESFCSEQNSRMTAMDSANQNAEKLLSELSIRYNTARQTSITQEITEISSGAAALRRRKEAGKF